MVRKWLLFIILFILSMSLVSAVNVNTCDDLHYNILYNQDITLTADIDCAGYTWNATCGDGSSPVFYSNGIFLGNNHTISNIYINGLENASCSIFGADGGSTASFSNFCINNATVIANNYAGALWGYDGTGSGTQTVEQVCVTNSLFKATTTASLSALGPIYGYWDGGAGYINNSYSSHNIILANSSSANSWSGGFCGSGVYNADILNSYAYNNTIYVGVGGISQVGGFIGRFETESPYLSLSILNKIINSTGSTIYTHSFFGDSGGNNNYFANDSGRTDGWATGASSTLYNKTTTEPLASWDFANIWKLGMKYPVFQWQEQQIINTTIAWISFARNATWAYSGNAIQWNTTWSSDLNLSHYIFSFRMDTGTYTWNNASAYKFNDGNNTCAASANCSGSWVILTDVYGPPVNISVKMFANNSADVWAVAMDGVDVYEDQNGTWFDFPPQWTNYSQSETSIEVNYTAGNASTIFFYANFTDGMFNISTRLLYINYSNGTYKNTNLPGIDANISATDYRFNDGWTAMLPDVGNYIWKMGVYDIGGNYNSTPWRNFSIVAAPVYPQWYNISQSATSVNQGTQVVFTANFTNTGNLSMYIPSYWNTTHWVNATLGILFGTYRTCIANYTNCQTLYAPIWTLPGLWRIKFYANNSQNNWNVSPIMNLTVNAIYPNAYNNTQNFRTVEMGSAVNMIFQVNFTTFGANLSYKTMQFNNGSWYNYVTYVFNASGIDTYTNSTDSKTYMNFGNSWLTAPGTYYWRILVNNSYGNSNFSATEVVYSTDTTNPTLLTFVGNTSNVSTTFHSVSVRANWTDNYRLNYYIASINPATGVWANASPALFSASTCGSNCSGLAAALNAVGIWQFKFFVNDSAGNWNTTGLWNVTVNADIPPAYYGYGTNITGTFYLGMSNYIYSNWSDDNGMTNCWLEETMPNSTKINWSSTLTCFNPEQTDCDCTNDGMAAPVGLHIFRMFMNDSSNNLNSTPYFNFSVNPTPPIYWNYESNMTAANITMFDNHIRFISNWSSPTYPAQNMSYVYFVLENASHHEIINETNAGCAWLGTLQTCNLTDYQDNTINLTHGAGQWRWKFWANNTGSYASTPWNDFNVSPRPENFAANLTYWSINPCINHGNWQVDQNYSLQLILTDVEDNAMYLRINITGYDGGNYTPPLVITDWSYVPNGSLYNLSNLSTLTTSGAGFDIWYRDFGGASNGTISHISFNFSVSTAGLLYGECLSNGTGVIAPAPATPSNATSAWTDLFSPLLDLSGLDLTIEIGWIVLMLIIVVVILVSFKSEMMLAGIGAFAFSIAWMIFGVVIHAVTAGFFGLIMFFLIAGAGLTIYLVVKKNGR